MFRNMVAALALIACTLAPGAAFAIPFDAGSVVRSAEDASPIEKARIVCINRYTGRIISYNPCGFRRRVHYYYRPGYRYYRPRVRYFYRPRFHFYF